MSKIRKISFLAILTLLVGQIGASAFTAHQVENRAKVLIYWGDVEENITTGNDTDFNGSVSGKDGRVLALQTLSFENSDKVTHKDSRATGKVEFTSNIEAGVDGLLLLVNENETELSIETTELGVQTISMNSLKSNEFSFNSGNLGLKAKYIGKDFLSTPENPSSSGKFDDTPTSQWYFKYVQRIKNREVENQPIFEGYKTSSGQLTGLFGPGDNITVGQMLKVVLRVSGHNELNTNLDASLTASTHWSVGFQNKAIDLGLTIMEAVGIDPNRTVSRGEFFQALVEAQGFHTSNKYKCSITDLDFNDLDSSNPYTKYACILVKDGVISGTDDGFLNLYNDINRAEVAKILNTALDIYVDQPSAIQTELKAVNDLDESNSSSNNGNTNTDVSFVTTATLQDSEIGYTQSLGINFATPSDVRENDIEIELSKDGSDLSNDITSTYTSGSFSIRRSSQWANGEYTIKITDKELNESKSLAFEVLNCGEQNNPCPSTGKFVENSTFDKDEFGYTAKGYINIGTPENFRESDLELTLMKSGSDFSNSLTTPTFNSSTGQIAVSLTQQWATGEYEITLKDTALNNEETLTFTVLNCGEQNNPCPSTGSFVPESTLGKTVLGYTGQQTVTFQEPSKVRESDIEITLEYENNDVSNDIVSSYSNGVLSIRRTTQWSSGSYSVTIKDNALTEEEQFFFTVTDQP